MSVISWYKEAFDRDEGDWTPPYFDRAASHQLTTTYLTHFHDGQGHKVGLLGVDVSLEWLRLRQLVIFLGRATVLSYFTIQENNGQC